jgi:hypothetical protein
MLSRFFVFALAGFASVAPAQETRYPPTRRAEQIDVLHGVRIADPYRWLEDTDSPETRAWIAAQNSVTNAFLASIPEREAIRRRLTELWNHPRAGVPDKEGGRYFFTENSGLQNQAVLYVQDSRNARPRVLLDPNLLSADGTVSLAQWTPAPNGRLLAYGISSGGSDWRELRVRDVLSRQVDDRVEALQDEGDDRALLHERGRDVIHLLSQPFLEVEVVATSELGVHLLHLDPDDFQSSILEPGDDPPGQRVRFGFGGGLGDNLHRSFSTAATLPGLRRFLFGSVRDGPLVQPPLQIRSPARIRLLSCRPSNWPP